MVRLTYSSFPLSKCRRLISATPWSWKITGTLGIEPGAAGREARMLPLCYAAPPRPLLVNVVAAAVDVNDSNQFPFSRPYFFFLEKRNFLHFGWIRLRSFSRQAAASATIVVGGPSDVGVTHVGGNCDVVGEGGDVGEWCDASTRGFDVTTIGFTTLFAGDVMSSVSNTLLLFCHNVNVKAAVNPR